MILFESSKQLCRILKLVAKMLTLFVNFYIIISMVYNKNIFRSVSIAKF